jgi:UDP-glucose 4-epimerase
MSQTTLTTGAAGFIGSHTVLELLNAGQNVICVDNCCNSYLDKNEKLPESLKRVSEITGKEVMFYNVDIRDKKALDSVFKKVTFYLNLKSFPLRCWNVSASDSESIFICLKKKVK